MASPNLGIPDIQDSDQPEIEANAAKDLLDESTNDNVVIVVTGDVTVTLAQYNENFIIKLTGTPGAPFDVFLPANKRKFAVWNASDATATIGVDDLGGGFLGTSQTLAAGKIAEYLSDQTNIEATGSGAISIEDDSIEKVAAATAINFTGPGVIVTDGGGGQADVDIQGVSAGVDSLLTTAARGALARNNANQSLTNATFTAILLQLEDRDTDAFHDPSTNNERMTIPAGVTKVRLKGNVRFAANGTGARQARITRNGANDTPHSQSNIATASSTLDSVIQVETPVLAVVAGDFFELEAQQDSGGALNVLFASEDTWFAIEVVETNDTVDLSAVAVTVKPKFRGALVRKVVNETTANFAVAAAISWDLEIYDTDNIHDNSTNNSRLTVPAGVSRVRLTGSVNLELATIGEWANLFLRKNGVAYDGDVATRVDPNFGSNNISVASPVVEVVEGDWFELWLRVEADTSITVTTIETNFSMEIIEEIGAGTQPTGFIAIQPLPRGAMVERTASQAITTAADVLIPTQTIWERKSVRGNNYWLGPNFTFVDGDVTVGTDTINEVGHGMVTGDGPFQFSNSGGALPTGLAVATNYFGIRVDNDNFKPAASLADALSNTPVDITAAAGGGTHTLERETRLVVPDGVTKVRVSANVKWDTSAFVRTMELLRNGSADANAFFERSDVELGEMHGSAILAVTPGDYLELQLDTSTNTNAVAANTWFMIEAVEEAEALSFPGVTVDRPHIGVRADPTGDQSLATSGTAEAVALASEQFDTGHQGVQFHDNSTNNSRFTIPAGVTKVKLRGQIAYQANATGIRQAEIRKSGASLDPDIVSRTPNTGGGDRVFVQVHTGVLPVAEADYFELFALQTSGGALSIDFEETWLEMEIVETEGSAFPPEEVATVEPLANGAALAIDTIEYAKVAVRRFSLFDDFAGSVGVATTAPTGTTSVFDVKRNDTIIGTITFAISATTATFVTTGSIEEVFEVGDILTIETQGTVNTVIRGISFSLWAWRS